MSDINNQLLERLKARFQDKATSLHINHNQVTMEVAVDAWFDVAKALRDETEFRFQIARDLCGVDFLGYGEAEWDTEDVSSQGFSRAVEGQGAGRFNWADRPRGEGPERRFAVVVHLLSIQHNTQLRIRCFANDSLMPIVASLVEIWPGLNWFEREAFDLFGIIFEGHPDLRRILTDYGFVGHPFRKDFPLIGNVEVRYDADKRRVIYEPVSIEPRVGVPRVLREDSRWLQAVAESASRKN